MVDDANTTKPKRLFTDLILADHQEVPCWIVGGILPKCGIYVFGGETKIGKSMVLLEMSRSLALGEPLFGNPDFVCPEQAKVLFFEQELGELMLADRARKIFSPYQKEPEKVRLLDENVWFVSKDSRINFSSREGREFIANVVDQVQPNVVLFDPIGKCHLYDENDNSDINKLFHSFQQLAELHKDRGMSICVSHHFAKKSTDPNLQRDPLSLDNFRGATRWGGDPDTLNMYHRTQTVQETKNGVEWKWWRLKSRYTLRGGADISDFGLTVNKDNDLRVHFVQYYKK